MGYFIFSRTIDGAYIDIYSKEVENITLKKTENLASLCSIVLGNLHGRNTGKIRPHDQYSIYYPYKDSNDIKIFTGNCRDISEGEQISFDLYDIISFLSTEYITEDTVYASQDAGIVIKDILQRSTWSIDTKYIDVNTGVIIDDVTYQHVSRRDAIFDLLDLINSQERKKYHIYTDIDNYIHLEQYNQREYPTLFFTTEDEMDIPKRPVYPEGAVLVMFLDEGYGTDTYDETENDNDGTLAVGATWDSDCYATQASIVFDGSVDAYVVIADDATLDLTGDFTFAITFKPNSVPLTYQHLIGKNTSYYVYYYEDHVGVKIYTGGAWVEETDVQITVTSDEWVTCAWTRNVTTGAIIAYKNGVQVATGTLAGAINTTANNLLLGELIEGVAGGIVCKIEFVLIDDAIYTEGQIEMLSKKPRVNGIITSIVKTEQETEYFNAVLCVAKNVSAYYPDRLPDNCVMKRIDSDVYESEMLCYLKAKNYYMANRKIPDSIEMSIENFDMINIDINTMCRIYVPHRNIKGNYRLKDLNLVASGNDRNMTLTTGSRSKNIRDIIMYKE